MNNEICAIPAIPSRYPTPDEIKLAELFQVVKRQWSQKRKGKPPELVNVRSILRNVRTMYLPAVLLQYELLGRRRQQQLAFAVDGVIQEEYEGEFARCGGPERIPDLLEPEFKTTPEIAADVLPPHVVRQLGPIQQADELVERIDQVTAELQRKESILEAEGFGPYTRKLLQEELDKEKALRAQLEEQLAKIKVRSLKTYDCVHLLYKSLQEAKTRLVIISAFLSSDVVDRQFVERLEGALKRKVNVWIGYGMGKHGAAEHDREERGDWKAAEREFKALSKKYPELLVKNLGNTHEKILLQDSAFVVTGSFNWLSFRPKGKRVRFEDAAQVMIPEFIEDKFQEIVARFA